MSIIERAAGRLNKDKGTEQTGSSPAAIAAEPAPVANAPRNTGDRIAEAMARKPDAQKSVSDVDITVQVVTVPASLPVPVPASAPAPAPKASVPSGYQAKSIEIDLTRLSELGFITAGGGRSLIAEQFRMIKRPLLKKAFESQNGNGNPGNLIMVTSSIPGEGKSFCSINLAMSIAMELDHTVLLVDVDVARPSVLRTLGVEPMAGLMDVLLDDHVNMTDVMLKTNVDTLSILPSGRGHPQAAELLASQAMQTLLGEIAARYPDRIVIFDSPPLLVTSEAHILAAKMGQIVLVVEAESTTQHAVHTSLEQLKGCPNINLIYNKSNTFPGANSYNYGFGKYY
jgi:protein-tyrosine kinase